MRLWSSTRHRAVATIATVAIAVASLVGSTPVQAAAPQPAAGSAVVDGSAIEWNLGSDYFAAMYRAFNPAKEHQSDLYLRYSCPDQRLYALVLTTNTPSGDRIPATLSAIDAWLKIDGQPGNLVDGNSASFAWVYDGTLPVGYEASASLAPGSYSLTAHIDVEWGGTQTSGTSGTVARTSIPLAIVCSGGTPTPTSTTTVTPTPTPRPVTIGDLAFEDMDGDGAYDAGEPGIAGVTVTLRDQSGAVVGTTSTDAAGNYLFTVPAGTYTVTFGAPAGYVASTPSLAPTTLAAGGSDLAQDAGFYRPVTIGNLVFEDMDGDGAYDAGEPGISGITVTLRDQSGAVVQTVVTDGSGTYTFTVRPGTYAVSFTAPAPYVASTPALTAITLRSGATNLDQDAGYYRPVKIGDLIWRDSDADGTYEPVVGEIPLAGVSVTLRNGLGVVIGTTTTNSNGLYEFAGLRPGTYTVTVTAPAGSTPTYDLDGIATANVAGVTTVSGTNRSDVDFGYRPLVAPGTGTPGYWKTHAEAWPVATITIGGVTYTRDQAIALMTRSDKQDRTLTMFQSLVSAKLNVAVGNDFSCVQSTILAADAWMATYPAGSGVAAGGATSPWRVGDPLNATLDAYNNGRLPCAVHRG